MLFKLFKHICKKSYRHFTELSWLAVTVLGASYGLFSYVMLSIAGDPLTNDIVDFVYYLITTGSTVGYGDLSPSTPIGKLITSWFVIPAGIGIFTVILGKMLTSFNGKWRMKMDGKGDYSSMFGHILMLGWQEERTEQMISHLKNDTNEEIILAVANETVETNPFPDDVKFIKGQSLSNEAMLKRAGICSASKIIVFGSTDEITLATSLAVHSLAKEADHIVAYFVDGKMASLLSSVAPEIEIVTSKTAEMMITSCMNPGSSKVYDQILSNANGPTQYSIVAESKHQYSDLYNTMKRDYHVTPIGVQKASETTPIINPSMQLVVDKGDTIFYIGDTRLKSWTSI